ncbi:peroxidase-related enzyme [Sphingopyxis sp. GW247-27LB]|uniref:peroxidase-related enzyme n=1 Tax=Sphingopyxis sp. GW247-27LB TaxID=2012632 RepID=UPI000BA6F263|nr:peroxidase-related enzyme [Sphingopyxis sp. GW247-27LB]PAL24202.1 alkylhydroperoxidase [Sphingopyxis sp. GW247-27LB]
MTDRYPFAEIGGLPTDLRERILRMQEKSGFIPNVIRTLARRPSELLAFLDYHDALMLREGGLTRGEKEMIVVATSNANGCIYCVVAHGALLRIYEKNSLLADQVAVNYRRANITKRQRRMIDFAMKVCLTPAEVGDDDFPSLYEVGFDDEDIWDIGAIVGLFGMSNRMVNVTGMRANEEYFMLGRLPRAEAPAVESV